MNFNTFCTNGNMNFITAVYAVNRFFTKYFNNTNLIDLCQDYFDIDLPSVVIENDLSEKRRQQF